MFNFLAPIGGFFSKLGQNVGGAVKKPFEAIAGGGSMAKTPALNPASPAIPPAEAMPNLSITPKSTMPSPLPPRTVAPASIGGNIAPPERTFDLNIQQPRMAGRTIADEYRMRQSDPNPEVVFRQPFGRERYDYVTKNGTVDPTQPHRGFKAGVKDFFTAGAMANQQLPANATMGERLGALIGGGATGAIMGKKDPVALEEQKFEMFQQPRLYRDMMMQNEQRQAEANIAWRNAQAQREAQQAVINREEQDRKNSLGQPVGPNGLYDPKTGKIIGQRQPTAPRPLIVSPGATVLDPQTGKPIYTAPEKETPLSPSEAAALAGLEVDANFDKGTARGAFIQGMRGQLDQQYGVTAEMRRLAQNPDLNVYKDDLSPQAKLAAQKVAEVEALLEKQADAYIEAEARKYKGQAALKKVGKPKTGPRSNPSSVNLKQGYKGDAAYNFKN